MEDQTLACKNCAQSFVFTRREQEFFAAKGFTNTPQRCLDCRQKRRSAGGDASGMRPDVEAVCAQCGVTTTLPFRPRGDRPVYCRTCYAAQATSPVLA